MKSHQKVKITELATGKSKVYVNKLIASHFIGKSDTYITNMIYKGKDRNKEYKWELVE